MEVIMATIKEAEMQTGITKQNIRYYEKIGIRNLPLTEESTGHTVYAAEWEW